VRVDFGAEEQVNGRSWEAGAGEQLNPVKVIAGDPGGALKRGVRLQCSGLQQNFRLAGPGLL
jgi:hypothetical protein